MKKLGQGWQYTVYDLENGRVLKKHNPRFQAYVIMLRDCFPYTEHPILKFPKYYLAGIQEAKDSLAKIRTTKINPELFGNPTILINSIDYEQDTALPLYEYFKENKILDSKKMIDAFAEFNKVLIQNNLIDKSFNIGKNFGINKIGAIVLLDLGELWSDSKNIQKQIQNRAQGKSYVLAGLPTQELRNYFLAKMEELRNLYS